MLQDAVAEVARLEGLAARDELHAEVDCVPRISVLELSDRSIRGGRAGVRDGEPDATGALEVVRGRDRARKPAAAGFVGEERKVGHRVGATRRGASGTRARTSICICAAARWASALAPDCAPASTERYCCTLAIADPTAVGDGGDSDADPPAHATQLCAARRWVRTGRGACPRRMRRPGRTRAVSRGPCPSLRVLSPPQLATRFVRRHKARRRLSVASCREQTVGPHPRRNNETHVPDRQFATVQKLAKSEAQGKTGGHTWADLRAFPTRFPPPSAQRRSQDLDTSAACSLALGGKTALLDWQALRRGHFSIRAGRSVRSSGQKTPLFSLECPFPACASTSRPPCAPRRHPLPARSMAPPRWVFQQKSPAVPQFRSPALCSRSRHAALLSSRRIAPLDGSMGPAHGSSGVPRVFSRAFFIAPRR